MHSDKLMKQHSTRQCRPSWRVPSSFWENVHGVWCSPEIFISFDTPSDN